MSLGFKTFPRTVYNSLGGVILKNGSAEVLYMTFSIILFVILGKYVLKVQFIVK